MFEAEEAAVGGPSRTRKDNGSLRQGRKRDQVTIQLKCSTLVKSEVTTTVGIRLTDMSGNQMVETCPIAEWFVN